MTGWKESSEYEKAINVLEEAQWHATKRFQDLKTAKAKSCTSASNLAQPIYVVTPAAERKQTAATVAARDAEDVCRVLFEVRSIMTFAAYDRWLRNQPDAHGGRRLIAQILSQASLSERFITEIFDELLHRKRIDFERLVRDFDANLREYHIACEEGHFTEGQQKQATHAIKRLRIASAEAQTTLTAANRAWQILSDCGWRHRITFNCTA